MKNKSAANATAKLERSTAITASNPASPYKADASRGFPIEMSERDRD